MTKIGYNYVLNYIKQYMKQKDFDNSYKHAFITLELQRIIITKFQRRNKMKIFMLLFVFIFLSCKPDEVGDPENIHQNNFQCDIMNYHNGVYYFECNSCDFGNALSSFIKNNNFLKVISIATSDLGLYGATNGYFVITELKSINDIKLEKVCYSIWGINF